MSRFLIVRLGALGDIVHTVPVAAAMRRAYPSSQIDWLVSAKHRPFLDLVPVIDGRLAIRDRGAREGMTIVAAVAALRRARYDIVFDLQGLLKSALLARATAPARVIGFSRAYLREPLARLFYAETFDPGGGGMYDPRETTHVVRMNLGVLSRIGLTVDTPEFPIDTTDSAVARQMRDAAGGRYALLNPGAAWPNKRWPAQRYAALAAEIRKRQGLRSVVSWGPGEEDLAGDVVREAAGAAVLSPPTTIADLVALVRGAAVMISGDTGPTHIGAAVGTPLVGLYGPTRPSRNGPLSPDDVTVSRDAICRCHHLRRCTEQRMCLLDIGVEEVAQAVERRLAARSSRA